MGDIAHINTLIYSTAGAVPCKNEKGEAYMQKVKVQRYVAGKRPEYAAQDSSDEDDFDLTKKKLQQVEPVVDAEIDDPRLRRLQELRDDDQDEDDEEEEKINRILRHRQLHEPEVLAPESDEEDENEDREDKDEESSDEELDEEEIERRRILLRQKAQQQQQVEAEVMEKEEEREGTDEESSEYEEYSDSEEEETGPRLKPVFVRKRDRITIQEKEKEALKQKEQEVETRRMAEERRKQTLKMVNEQLKKEQVSEKAADEAVDGLNSGEENDEEEYEAWKLRELKRIKRDRDVREAIAKEQQEVEKIRNMTEDERYQYFSKNKRTVTNKAEKGKYKFLQKYYHRGAFFLDNEEEVFKRDFAKPTLEDHFDKTILPKVMQVKNFGRSGRTKYTHLVDQDTTSFDMPWASNAKSGAGREQFERPSKKRK